MQDSNTHLHLTSTEIERYLQAKLDSGVSAAAAAKYRKLLNNLQKWLGEDTELTAAKLKEWRKYLEEEGYGKSSVQNHIKAVNTFLRFYKRSDMCIPKPLRNDLRGKSFGYLTVMEVTEKRQRRNVVWLCKCRCGKEVEIPAVMLMNGHTTSCGCLNIEILKHCNRYEEGTELRQALEERIVNPNSASGYVGVSPKRDKWTAHITFKGKYYYLGTYYNLEDAVKARARAKEAVMEEAERIYKETAHLYERMPRRLPPPKKVSGLQQEAVSMPKRHSNNTSGYSGVTKQYGKWSASITANKYRYQLGVYDELEDAIAARKQAEDLVQAGRLDLLRAICTNHMKGEVDISNI